MLILGYLSCIYCFENDREMIVLYELPNDGRRYSIDNFPLLTNRVAKLGVASKYNALFDVYSRM